MRKFSRWMPPLAEYRLGVEGCFAIGVIVAMVVAGATALDRKFGVIALSLIAYMIGAEIYSISRLRRMASERTGEDIGTFARAFDRRNELFEPWVVRATWNALQPYAQFPGGRLPVRPSDHLLNELHIDPDDLDDYLVKEVAVRARRSLVGWVSNPYASRIETVGDLVRFLSHQPVDPSAT